MENYTYNSYTLQMEGLNITKDYIYPSFFLLLIFYIVSVVMNIGISVLIFINKKLHQPMYFIFCNLSLSDIIGCTNMFPRLLADILRPPSERLISYYACVVQAFITQLFGTTSHTVLMIMAFDRYVAICYPLRYSTIMTNKMVMKLTVSAWGVAFVLVGILLGLTIRLNRCRTMIMNSYCDNASLFKLSCESVFINNVYGLTFTVVLYVGSIGSMVLTYTKIAVVCLTSKNKSLNSKALKTCSTHLAVYLIMSFSGFVVIILHRFPQYSDYRKLSFILFVLVPGTLNSIIYGVQSREIRKYFSTPLLRPDGSLNISEISTTHAEMHEETTTEDYGCNTSALRPSSSLLVSKELTESVNTLVSEAQKVCQLAP
ncbi:olfactory receptor 52N5-like [Larimichthys crocea]|uniref:olfactory receptor 52N5-like n=1 Tax=Larimichthys crocea TaxID=215358 RepID=UPI000F5F2A67|nr:olfactory receptor 52N5-like [Larimichthys crocea]